MPVRSVSITAHVDCDAKITAECMGETDVHLERVDLPSHIFSYVDSELERAGWRRAIIPNRDAHGLLCPPCHKDARRQFLDQWKIRARRNSDVKK